MSRRTFIIPLIFSAIALLGTGIGAGAQSASGSNLKSGYRGMVEIGGGPGVGEYGDAAVWVSTTQGWQFGPYFYAGVGAALNRLNIYETSMYDFFADFRGYLNDNEWTPMAGLKVGYSPFTTVNRGPYGNFVTGESAVQKGFFVSPSFGVSLSLGKALGVSLTISDNIQTGRFYSVEGSGVTPSVTPDTPTEKHLINTITFTVGFYW